MNYILGMGADFLCIYPKSYKWLPPHVSHADHSQLALLVVAVFAVYIFARICLPVSKLPAANSAHLCMVHFNTQNLNLWENVNV